MKIINYEEKEMIPLTDKANKSYEKEKVCYIWKNENENENEKKKKIKIIKMHLNYTIKSEIMVITLENLKELLIVFAILRYKTPKKIPVVFHNGSTYDYHFITNKLGNKFFGEFECEGENTEKCITFSVPISRELDNSKTITCRLKFIDSFRFMPTSLSSHVDNLSEKLHSDKCKDCKSELDYMSVKYNQLIFQCLECKKNYNKDCNKKLIKRFANTCRICNGDIKKFMNNLKWIAGKYLMKHHYQIKKAFYRELNLEDITDKDYAHAQKFFEELKLKNLGHYHDYHICSN